MPKRRIKPDPGQIKSWVSTHFPDHKMARHGQEIRIHNPFCVDNGYHVWINLNKAKVHDFRPDYGHLVNGSFLWFVKKYLNVSFRDAVRSVCGDRIAEEIIDDIEYKKYERTNIQLPSTYVSIDLESKCPIMKSVIRYLDSRCITTEQMISKHIGHDNYDVIFPYYERGRIVYWQSRSILNKSFNFPANTSKSDHIYGIDDIESDEYVVIAESIFNALVFERGAAVGGSDIGRIQRLKLKSTGVKKVILAFDNDESGKRGVANAYQSMKDEFDLYYSFTDGDDDWNKIAQDFGLIEARTMLDNNMRKLDMRNYLKIRI